MSHLQPKFIAKAKAQTRQTKAPQRMSDSLVHREASRYHVYDFYSAFFGNAPKGKPMLRFQCTFVPDHRQFTLRK